MQSFGTALSTTFALREGFDAHLQLDQEALLLERFQRYYQSCNDTSVIIIVRNRSIPLLPAHRRMFHESSESFRAALRALASYVTLTETKHSGNSDKTRDYLFNSYRMIVKAITQKKYIDIFYSCFVLIIYFLSTWTIAETINHSIALWDTFKIIQDGVPNIDAEELYMMERLVQYVLQSFVQQIDYLSIHGPIPR